MSDDAESGDPVHAVATTPPSSGAGAAPWFVACLLAVSLPLPTPYRVEVYQHLALVVAGACWWLTSMRGRSAAASLLTAGALAAAALLPSSRAMGELPRALVIVVVAAGSFGSWARSTSAAIHAAAAAAVVLLASGLGTTAYRAGDQAALSLWRTYGALGLGVPRVSWDYVDVAAALWAAAALALSFRRPAWKAVVLVAGTAAAACALHAAVSLLGRAKEEPPTIQVALAFRAAAVIGILLASRSRSSLGRAAEAPAPATQRVRGTLPRLAAAAALVLGVAAVWTSGLAWSSGAPVRVLVLDRGLVDWTRADYTRFDDFAIGMFGELPRYAAVDGVTVERGFATETFSAGDLSRFDVVVSVNNGVPWRDGELRVLDGFVRRGGGLLALCDHTDVAGQRGPTNELLNPYGVDLQFDSAVGRGAPVWTKSIRPFLHAATRGIHDLDFHHAVGASLELSGGAEPLLVGGFAVADAGLRENEMGAFLGNYEWDPGERRGGLVLAAHARAGDGRVVVLGDTTAFQNACMFDYWGFARRVLRYAAGGLTTADAATSGLWSAAVALVLLAVLLRRDAATATALAAMVALAAGLEARSGAAGGTIDPPVAAIAAGEDCVLLEDLAARDAPAHDTTYKQRGDGHFSTSLLRNGCLVYDGCASAHPVRPQLVVVNNPAWPLGDPEQEALLRHVRGGGAALVVVGPRSAACVARLLDAGDVRVLSRTLGNRQEPAGIRYDRSVGNPRFVEPWEVSAPGTCDVLAAIGGAPVIVRTRLGAGVLVVVGDPRFLENCNLDVRLGAPPSNQILVKTLLDACGVRTAPREGHIK